MASLLALVAASVLTSASPAAASSASLELCCGWVKNTSGRATITVLRDWCSDGEYLLGPRPCGGSYRTLLPDQSTPSFEDWDGVGIGGNCYGHVVKYTVGEEPEKTLDVPIDRRGRPAMWVRVHDNEIAFAAQTC